MTIDTMTTEQHLKSLIAERRYTVALLRDFAEDFEAAAPKSSVPKRWRKTADRLEKSADELEKNNG